METKEITLTDYWRVIWKRRKLIVITVLSISFISAGISLILPKWYKATAVIMPPVKETMPGLSSMISQLPFGGFGIGGVSEETDTYLAILKSRTVTESVIKKFNIIEKYEAKNMEEAVKSFRKNAHFMVEDEGTISIGVLDKDQELVPHIANFFMEELDRTNKRLATERARNNRLFIEKRVNETEEKLAEMEDRVREFQEKYSAIDIDTQTEEAIRAAADLKARIITLEVEIGVMEKSVSKSHPDLLRFKTELSELQKKFNSMRFGGEENSREDIFPPFSEIPEIGLKYVRLLRDVEIQSKLLEYLIPEYEQAKIQEAKDTPTVQVLDRAVKPEKKYKPKRSIIVLFYSFLSFVFILAYILFKPAFVSFYKNLK
ncbi:hypothetical protein ISS37_02820 [candidate division KSB1 bacterium]|nr:hypothetical protein [candidate division KSB1 bacterium]